MENSETKSSDKVIFESMISLRNDRFDTLLTLTEKHLLFQQKKGIFYKKYKTIKDILINDIKVVNNKVQIKHKKNKITIYTKDDEITFVCKTIIEARKLVEKINETILGEEYLKRFFKKVKKIVKVASVIIGGISLIVTKIDDESKELKDIANKVKNFSSKFKLKK